MGPVSVRAGCSVARMSEPATGSGRTTMCAKPPQGAERTGTWTTVGTMGRVGWAKAIAMGAVSVRAGSSAARISGPPTGSRRTTMCAKPPQGGGRTGTWTTVGTMGRVGVGEGDCDGSSQCQSGLQCSQDIGATLRVPGELRCVRSRRRGGAERARGLLSGLWAVQCGRRRLRWEQSVSERAPVQPGYRGPTGSRRTTMCASSAAGAVKKGPPGARPQGVSQNGRLLGHQPRPPIGGRTGANVCFLLVAGICVRDTR